MAMVNDSNYGDLLIEGLTEAVAFHRGELKGVTVTRRERTARTSAVASPPEYEADAIVGIRERIGVSQAVFAGMLNTSDSTVKAWERGARTPSGPTLRLLELADKHPDVFEATVTPRPGRKRAAKP
ncbi:MAG TPA: helix-turn-helix domain-containing protein [Longimicrobiaceae bacterium]|jgi:putative transcriptional regulator|nr:helix-turn-helix domain-containing protein [Longimicrobiaceae bacterium]